MNLKNTLSLLFIFVLLNTLISCENDTQITPVIKVAKEELSFGKDQSSSSLAIQCNTKWTATSSQTWCTVTPSSGEAGTKQLTVTVSANTSGMRQAIITIAAGSVTKEIQISQSYEQLTLDPKTFAVNYSGGEITVQIQASSAITTTIGNSWITLKSENATSKTYTIAANSTILARTGKVIFTAGSLKDSITINQSGTTLSVPADASGMTSTITQIAKNMYMGWNLGNTLEVPGNETGWGNPKATQLLIDSVKRAGFNAVRLPCAWDSYIEDKTTHKIKDSWLARVKEVVDYCYSKNMYVMFNIHWDGGWLEENCTEAKKVENNAKQKAIWEQLAVYFRDYDEHLLFASANEPNVDNATQMTVLLSYHQTFVNAVRSTGGRNAYRTLVIQGPRTDITKTNTLMTAMPTDIVPNRLMAEIHYYTPWTFCGITEDATWGKMTYYWGTGNLSTTDTSRNYANGEAELKNLFALMKTKFVDHGIPVILGEFGAVKRNLSGDALTLHLKSRAYFYNQVAEHARKNGIIPFLWDTGIHGSNDMGIINRSTGAVEDDQAHKALMDGAAAGTLPY